METTENIGPGKRVVNMIDGTKGVVLAIRSRDGKPRFYLVQSDGGSSVEYWLAGQTRLYDETNDGPLNNE